MEYLFRKVSEKEYLIKEKREYELLAYTAKERYLPFRNDYKSLTERIPKYQIANYLGIDPSSLNRMIKSLA